MFFWGLSPYFLSNRFYPKIPPPQFFSFNKEKPPGFFLKWFSKSRLKKIIAQVGQKIYPLKNLFFFLKTLQKETLSPARQKVNHPIQAKKNFFPPQIFPEKIFCPPFFCQIKIVRKKNPPYFFFS